MPSERTGPRRWTLIALVGTASFINYLDRGSLAVALPVISRDLGLNPIHQGIALSAFFWTYTAMQIPMGRVVDRFSIKGVYAVSFALWSLAAAATGLARNLWELVACRIVLGIGEAVYLPGGMKVVSLNFKSEESAWPAGVFDLCTKIGLAAGTAIDVWLLVTYGWRSLFFRTGLFGLLWLIPWLWLYPPGRSSAAAARPIEWSKLTTDRTLVAICVGFFCWDYFWYFLISWLPTYLYSVRHIPLPQIALFGALPFLVFGAAEGFGGWIAGVFVRRGYGLSVVTKTVSAVGFGLGLFIIPAALVESPAASIAFLLAACLCGIACPNLIAMPKICAREDQVALWVGIMNCAGNIGGVIAPALTGFVIARTGSYVPAFLTASVVLVVGIIAYTLMLPELRSSVEREAAA